MSLPAQSLNESMLPGELSHYAPDPAETLRRRLEGATRLVEMTRRLAGEENLDGILAIVTAECCIALNCERANLFLFDEEAAELYTRVASDSESLEMRHSIHHGLSGWVFRNRQTAMVQDLAHDPFWRRLAWKDGNLPAERNVLAIPVLSRSTDEVIGVLEVLNRASGLFDGHDEHLLQAFGAHAAAAIERSELIERLAETRELELAMQAARNVQSNFLPTHLPDAEGYELAAWWQPAQAVGGDYYDVVPLPDGRLGLAVADVSGHGLGPALIMASARAMLHVLAQTSTRPGRILNLLAQTIQPDLFQGRFITFLMAALDLKTHELRYANAGHGPAFVFRRSDQTIIDLKATGMPVGILDERIREQTEPIHLDRGDLLILATDGMVEQRDADRQMFGRQRLQDLVQQNQHLAAAEIVQVLKQAIRNHFTGDHPDDDITLLVVERKLGPAVPDGASDTAESV